MIEIPKYDIITRYDLDKMTDGNCMCCNEPFSSHMPPDITGRCHTGPVYLSYWDG